MVPGSGHGAEALHSQMLLLQDDKRRAFGDFPPSLNSGHLLEQQGAGSPEPKLERTEHGHTRFRSLIEE